MIRNNDVPPYRNDEGMTEAFVAATTTAQREALAALLICTHLPEEAWECAACFAEHEGVSMVSGHSAQHGVGGWDPDTCEWCWLATK